MSSEVKIKNYVIINERATVEDALNVMERNDYNSLVVIDDNERPVGIITYEKAVKYRNSKNITIDKLMDKTIVTISGKEDPLDLFIMMMRNKINIVVETDKHGRVKKIITLRDIFNIIQKKAEKI
ncbi:CBS domain-containing protein [Acidianus manzaensis]|uniref:CBS domain-containing protein n=1 Tax=Acidianus manzaensis TaxID=282676 RepID=A0A1W6JYJ3_9CREN|nr:CBS domain-containing protein [Acidianus manzaensis]ARM75317.1 hypothetical protein B6F84_04235 [Acidianus manzaensis]